jgi:hypothetical protein
VISNALEAAAYMLEAQADKGIDDHISEQICSNVAFDIWEAAMQRRRRWYALRLYKNEYPLDDYREVDDEIGEINWALSVGQSLFHGGVWPADDRVITTDRPLSTSFSPQVALRNFDQRDKAYKSKTVQLWVIRVVETCSPVYFYDLGDRDGLGHEMEVLFASGACLELRSRRPWRGRYPVFREFGANAEYRPMELLEVDIR